MPSPPGPPQPQRRDVVVPRGRVRLAGTLLLPAGDGPWPCVVFVHGRGSSKESPRNAAIAWRLADHGIAAFLFDLSGHGESTPDPGRGDEAFVDDTAAGFEWATRQPELEPHRIGVAGSSLGAVVALDATLAERVTPAALALRAPPIDPGALDRLTVPALVVIGSGDPLLPWVRSAAERCPLARLLVVRGAGHLFDEPGTLEEVVRETVRWFEARLAVEPVAVADEQESSEWRGGAR